MANPQLWDTFFMSQSYGFLGERRGGSDTFSIAYITIFGHFGCFVNFCSSPFFVTEIKSVPFFCYQDQICTTGSITSKIRGEGVRPLMEDFHNLAAFFGWLPLMCHHLLLIPSLCTIKLAEQSQAPDSLSGQNLTVENFTYFQFSFFIHFTNHSQINQKFPTATKKSFEHTK